MRSGLIGWARRTLSNPTITLIIAGVFLLVAFSYFFNAKPAGLGPAELMSKDNSQSLTVILHSGINAPHNLLSYGLHSIGMGWHSSIRLSSTIFAAIFLGCFLWLARLMFGREVGLMGVLVLLGLPIFLVAARNGSGVVMPLWIIILMALYLWLGRDDNDRGLIILSISAALALYIPGLLIWMAAAALLSRKKISAMLESAEPPVVGAAILTGVLLIVPLVYAIINNHSLLNQLFLIPSHWPSPVRFLKNIAWMVLALFVKTPHHSPLIIGRLPLFSLIADALIVFGVVAMWNAARRKLFVLAAAIFYAVIVAALNDNVELLVLAIPAAAVIMCAGLRYLYIEWRRVFPLNPVAKTVALLLMWVLVIVQLAFGARYALIAWPQTNDTHSTYVLK